MGLMCLFLLMYFLYSFGSSLVINLAKCRQLVPYRHVGMHLMTNDSSMASSDTVGELVSVIFCKLPLKPAVFALSCLDSAITFFFRNIQ